MIVGSGLTRPAIQASLYDIEPAYRATEEAELVRSWGDGSLTVVSSLGKATELLPCNNGELKMPKRVGFHTIQRDDIEGSRCGILIGSFLYTWLGRRHTCTARQNVQLIRERKCTCCRRRMAPVSPISAP